MNRDLLLGLDETSLAWRKMLCVLADHIGHATLVGSPAPIVERMLVRMSKPEPGDYVYERAMSRPGARGEQGPVEFAHVTGFLLRQAQEPMWTEEEWQAELDWYDKHPRNSGPPERPTERIWYIQYGPSDDDVCRWGNATFTMIPLDRDLWRDW
jgi:hypothetical protein